VRHLIPIRGGWLNAVTSACVMACVLPAATAQTSTTSARKSGEPAATHAPAAKTATSPRSTTTHKVSAGAAAGTSATSRKATRSSSRKKRTARVRGQKKIDADRAQAIQEALIREHYFNGQATGTWNQASEDAMRRYQADHGWQSKTVPDSRALIKLGLGPSHDHLLNPESAMTTGPDAPRVASIPSTNASPSRLDRASAPVKSVPAEPVPAANPNSRDSSSPQ
jgi:putative peptidoglycan binding protein